MSTKSKSLYLLLVGILLLQACSMGQQPLSEDAAREEISSFLLDFIVTQEIGATADFIRTTDMPWVDSPPSANIIVYAPPKETIEYSFQYLDYERAITVWWFADGKLSEVTDKHKAIEEYESKYMKDPSSDIFAWGFYDFGIINISSNFRSAEVYVGASCGPLCGHGRIYKIKRHSNGQWEIYDSEDLWWS